MLLEVEGLNIRFQTESGRVTAVEDVALSIENGEVLGVVGESGCGKSVTAQSLMRLLREPPAEVSFTKFQFAGQDLTQLSVRDYQSVRGRQMGMIFQEPMTSLNPVYRVGAQIGETLQIHFPQLSSSEVRERTVAAMAEVGIPEPSQRYFAYPHELSGGLRQRVMIAMALIAGPKLLIADEPTTALDVTIQAQILRLLRDLQEQRGMSVLLISHDFGVMAEVADRILVMYAGRVVESAPWSELLAKPRHPYTLGLLRCIPGTKRPRERLDGIPGSVPSLANLPKGCRFQDRCPIVQPHCRSTQPPLAAVTAKHQVACFEVKA